MQKSVPLPLKKQLDPDSYYMLDDGDALLLLDDKVCCRLLKTRLAGCSDSHRNGTRGAGERGRKNAPSLLRPGAGIVPRFDGCRHQAWARVAQTFVSATNSKDPRFLWITALQKGIA